MQYAIGRKEVVIIETKEVTACRGLAGASDVGGVYQFIFSEGSDTVRNTPQQRTLRPPQAYCPKQRSR